MVLEKQRISFPFQAGVNTKADGKSTPDGYLEVLENARFDKFGAIKKRNGYTELAQLDASVNAAGLYTHKGQLLASRVDGKVFPYDPAVDAWGTRHLGIIKRFHGEYVAAAGFANVDVGSLSVDTDQSGNYLAMAWRERRLDDGSATYNYMAAVYELSTMTLLRSPVKIAVASDPGTVYHQLIEVAGSSATSNDAAFELVYEDSSNNIKATALYVNASTVTVKTARQLVAAANYNVDIGDNKKAYTAFKVSTPNKIGFAYARLDGGADEIRYVHLGINSTTGNSVDVAVSGTGDWMRGFASSQGGTAKVYVMFQDSPAGDDDVHEIEEVTPTNTMYVHNIVGSTNATGFFLEDSANSKVLWVDGSNLGSNKESLTPNSTTVTNIAISLAAGNAGFGAMVEDTVFIGVHEYNASNLTHLTLLAEVGDIDLNTLSHNTMAGGVTGEVVERDTVIGSGINSVQVGDVLYVAIPYVQNIESLKDSASTQKQINHSGVRLLRLDLSTPTAGLSFAELGGSLLVGCGGLASYDGSIVGEYAPCSTQVITTATAIAGGDLDASATYKYKTVISWYDAVGNLHRSSPSPAETETTDGTNKEIKVTCTQGHPTARYDGVEDRHAYIELYRTQGGGSLFSKVGSAEQASSDLEQSFSDALSDSEAAEGETLYTDTGELANIVLPNIRYVATHRSRIFVICADNLIRFSKEYIRGLAPGFADSFYISLPGSDNDRPVALASFGSNLIIIREKSIWTLDGEGPSKTGDGRFYQPRLLSSQYGGKAETPVLVTDEGVWFQSPNGIHILTSEGVEYIGAPVEDQLGSGTVVAMVVHQESETIRFVLTDKVLVYNYTFKQWSIDTYSSLSPNTFVGAANVSGTFYLLTSDGYLWKEDASFRLDSTYLPLKIRTGWIKAAGFQGRQRVWRFHVLGETRDINDLTVTVYYDYDTSISDTFSVVQSATGVLEFRGELSRQQCRALQFEFEDATTGSPTTYEGYSINELSLEVGVKQGNEKFSTSDTYKVD
jgi:hypothetical protein